MSKKSVKVILNPESGSTQPQGVWINGTKIPVTDLKLHLKQGYSELEIEVELLDIRDEILVELELDPDEIVVNKSQERVLRQLSATQDYNQKMAGLNRLLREALIGFVGTENPKDLTEMRENPKSSPVLVKAIDVLRATKT